MGSEAAFDPPVQGRSAHHVGAYGRGCEQEEYNQYLTQADSGFGMAEPED